jgi:ABC-type uncharacterized transport system permease subunit
VVIANVARIFRLWGVYGRMDFLIVTRDLRMFLTYSISDLIMNIAGVLGMWLLAERFAGIGPWTRADVCFLLGYGATTEGILATFFGYNILYISRRLGRGQMDHTLVQPQPIWISLLTEGFSPAFGVPTLLVGVSVMSWALFAPGGTATRLTPLWIACLVLNLFASAAIVLAFQFVWGSLAFYAPRSAEEISSRTIGLMSQLKVFPLDGLGAFAAGGLLTVLPVGFVAWRPSQALLGLSGRGTVDGTAPPWLLPAAWQAPLAAVCFWLVAAAVFQKGLQHYERVGSSRYSAFGHRR